VTALLTIVVLLRCAEVVEGGPEGTSLLLTIESRVQVTDVGIKVRNIDDESAEISKSLGPRGLEEEPLVLLILPSPIIQDQFLVHVRGYDGAELVGAAANLYTFRQNEQIEATLVLNSGFNDTDVDGFEHCNDGPHCDCNDQNDRINPFQREKCGDSLDNNCSGYPVDEGCPCNSSDPPEACTPLTEHFLHLAGIGMCYFGVVECIDGRSQDTCNGGTFAGEGEIDGNLLDDNCNGVVDEGSPCTAGQERDCFLGWVEPFPREVGANYPDFVRFDFAFNKTHGVAREGVSCRAGRQRCNANGLWENRCDGEVLPQRAPLPQVGWVELPSDPTANQCGQCDGLDNDCNGQFDEEPWFDTDGDGYTYCGTIIDDFGDPQNPDDKRTGMSGMFVDCNDGEPSVNPGQVEVCGNTVDEDCRCDHNNTTVHGSDTIGVPVLGPPLDPNDPCTRPASACRPTDAYLNCARAPRSGLRPAGLCSDGPSDECPECQPHYLGYFGAKDGCYLCRENFGFWCSDDGQCTTQAQDCSQCAGSAPEGQPDEPRPYCTEKGNGCSGTTPPQWRPLDGTDRYGDCSGIDCAGHYHGIQGGRCYEKADQQADEVDCDGKERCEEKAALCEAETEPKLTPMSQGICQVLVSGCTGTTPPGYELQAENQDFFNECNDSYSCETSEADGGPFYFGIAVDADGNNQCYLRANVADSSCNGAGACQSRAEACSAAPRGAVVVGFRQRPPCQTPDTGCVNEIHPSYVDVPTGTDPYDDCPRGNATAVDLDCYENGECYRDLGESCTADEECQPPNGNCVDGVCCSVSSCGQCQRCDIAGDKGTCHPWTGEDGVSCEDDCTHCLNGICTPRAAGDSSECTGICQACTTAGGNCGGWTGADGLLCTGTDTFCCSGACVEPGGEYGKACGTDDCLGGKWNCNGTAPRCSSYGRECDHCVSDTRHDATCTDNFGTTCSTAVSDECPACTSCLDNQGTTSCVATGGVHDYDRGDDDDSGLYQCTGDTGCSGSGSHIVCTCNGKSACLLAKDQECSANSQCASNHCVSHKCN
jgi:hypothetical protein